MDFIRPFTERSFFLIAGPCVIESREHTHFLAAQLQDLAEARGIPFIFKASFDKANRTSGKSFRGIGLERGLEILGKVRAEFGVPVLTDVHTEAQATIAALQWTKITPDNVPQVGDEAYSAYDGDFTYVQSCDLGTAQEWTNDGWTHLRPISPPAQASAA